MQTLQLDFIPKCIKRKRDALVHAGWSDIMHHRGTMDRTHLLFVLSIVLSAHKVHKDCPIDLVAP